MSAPLSKLVRRVIIVAHKEVVSALERALQAEGWQPEVQRLQYDTKELTYPAQSRCFMNHREAWRKATLSDGYTMICEADFVPGVGLGRFPAFWPLEDPMAWGYLYQGSPRVLALLEEGGKTFVRGHCAPLVGYIVSREVAKILLDFFEYESKLRGLENYFTFDAHLQWGAMGRGGKAFIPDRHYGEHGGRPNAEHAILGLLPRSGVHHADNLASRLHFIPQYAEGSRVRYVITRVHYRLLGIARLITGRWIVETNVYRHDTKAKLRMMWLGARRLLTPRAFLS